MPSPFGFSVLSKLFAYLGTDREWPLQVAPFLAGLAFIPVFYLVIRRVVQRPEITALACLVVACHPVAELYATRVKHYTLDALVALLLWGLFIDLRLRPSLRRFGGFIAVALMVAAVLVCVTVRQHRRRARARPRAWFGSTGPVRSNP